MDWNCACEWMCRDCCLCYRQWHLASAAAFLVFLWPFLVKWLLGWSRTTEYVAVEPAKPDNEIARIAILHMADLAERAMGVVSEGISGPDDDE